MKKFCSCPNPLIPYPFTEVFRVSYTLALILLLSNKKHLVEYFITNAFTYISEERKHSVN